MSSSVGSSQSSSPPPSAPSTLAEWKQQIITLCNTDVCDISKLSHLLPQSQLRWGSGNHYKSLSNACTYFDVQLCNRTTTTDRIHKDGDMADVGIKCGIALCQFQVHLLCALPSVALSDQEYLDIREKANWKNLLQLKFRCPKHLDPSCDYVRKQVLLTFPLGVISPSSCRDILLSTQGTICCWPSSPGCCTVNTQLCDLAKATVPTISTQAHLLNLIKCHSCDNKMHALCLTESITGSARVAPPAPLKPYHYECPSCIHSMIISHPHITPSIKPSYLVAPSDPGLTQISSASSLTSQLTSAGEHGAATGAQAKKSTTQTHAVAASGAQATMSESSQEADASSSGRSASDGIDVTMDAQSQTVAAGVTTRGVEVAAVISARAAVNSHAQQSGVGSSSGVIGGEGSSRSALHVTADDLSWVHNTLHASHRACAAAASAPSCAICLESNAPSCTCGLNLHANRVVAESTKDAEKEDLPQITPQSEDDSPLAGAASHSALIHSTSAHSRTTSAQQPETGAAEQIDTTANAAADEVMQDNTQHHTEVRAAAEDSSRKVMNDTLTPNADEQETGGQDHAKSQEQKSKGQSDDVMKHTETEQKDNKQQKGNKQDEEEQKREDGQEEDVAVQTNGPYSARSLVSQFLLLCLQFAPTATNQGYPPVATLKMTSSKSGAGPGCPIPRNTSFASLPVSPTSTTLSRDHAALPIRSLFLLQRGTMADTALAVGPDSSFLFTLAAHIQQLDFFPSSHTTTIPTYSQQQKEQLKGFASDYFTQLDKFSPAKSTKDEGALYRIQHTYPCYRQDPFNTLMHEAVIRFNLADPNFLQILSTVLQIPISLHVVFTEYFMHGLAVEFKFAPSAISAASAAMGATSTSSSSTASGRPHLHLLLTTSVNSLEAYKTKTSNRSMLQNLVAIDALSTHPSFDARLFGIGHDTYQEVFFAAPQTDQHLINLLHTPISETDSSLRVAPTCWFPVLHHPHLSIFNLVLSVKLIDSAMGYLRMGHVVQLKPPAKTPPAKDVSIEEWVVLALAHRYSRQGQLFQPMAFVAPKDWLKQMHEHNKETQTDTDHLASLRSSVKFVSVVNIAAIVHHQKFGKKDVDVITSFLVEVKISHNVTSLSEYQECIKDVGLQHDNPQHVNELLLQKARIEGRSTVQTAITPLRTRSFDTDLSHLFIISENIHTSSHVQLQFKEKNNKRGLSNKATITTSATSNALSISTDVDPSATTPPPPPPPPKSPPTKKGREKAGSDTSDDEEEVQIIQQTRQGSKSIGSKGSDKKRKKSPFPPPSDEQATASIAVTSKRSKHNDGQAKTTRPPTPPPPPPPTVDIAAAKTAFKKNAWEFLLLERKLGKCGTDMSAGARIHFLNNLWSHVSSDQHLDWQNTASFTDPPSPSVLARLRKTSSALKNYITSFKITADDKAKDDAAKSAAAAATSASSAATSKSKGTAKITSPQIAATTISATASAAIVTAPNTSSSTKQVYDLDAMFDSDDDQPDVQETLREISHKLDLLGDGDPLQNVNVSTNYQTLVSPHGTPIHSTVDISSALSHISPKVESHRQLFEETVKQQGREAAKKMQDLGLAMDSTEVKRLVQRIKDMRSKVKSLCEEFMHTLDKELTAKLNTTKAAAAAAAATAAAAAAATAAAAAAARATIQPSQPQVVKKEQHMTTTASSVDDQSGGRQQQHHHHQQQQHHHHQQQQQQQQQLVLRPPTDSQPHQPWIHTQHNNIFNSTLSPPQGESQSSAAYRGQQQEGGQHMQRFGGAFSGGGGFASSSSSSSAAAAASGSHNTGTTYLQLMHRIASQQMAADEVHFTSQDLLLYSDVIDDTSPYHGTLMVSLNRRAHEMIRASAIQSLQKHR